MAIPGIPNKLTVQQANRQILVSYNASPGATSYLVNRSLDGTNFTLIATISTITYLDTAVTVGTQYFYQVAASNASGISPFSSIDSAIPTPTSEMSLAELRLKAKQRADLVQSPMVTDPEWNSYINQSLFELYDLLVNSFEDYYLAPAACTAAISGQQFYPIPDGITQFQTISGISFTAAPMYKLRGVDLMLNNSNQAGVTLKKFMFERRNQYLYPNTGTVIYGVFNPEYRLMGNQIEFIPAPSGNQTLILWYIPRLAQLLQDTDITTVGFSGWLEYVLVRAAILALTKEESDTTKLEGQLLDLRHRIEAAAKNRDVGSPDKITESRDTWSVGNGYGWGPGGSF